MQRTEEGTNDRRVVIMLGIAVVGVVGYFGAGMPGMDHSGGGAASMSMSMPEPVALEPAAFARRAEDRRAVLVDVHEPPAARSIAGTDVWVAADGLVGSPGLPEDLDVPILVYCRNGSMAADAATSLAHAGHRDVAYLDGGTKAWSSAGLPLVPVTRR